MQKVKSCIEVFKTDVVDANESRRLVQLLLLHYPEGRINFDLEDCDRILRVEDHNIVSEKIVTLLNVCGYTCEALV